MSAKKVLNEDCCSSIHKHSAGRNMRTRLYWAMRVYHVSALVSIQPGKILSGLVEIAPNGRAQGDFTLSRIIIDDGFRADLVEEATFAGVLEIPTIFKPDEFIIPVGMVPFSCRNRTDGIGKLLDFYEHDLKFNDVITATDQHLDDFRKFSGIVSPDCSLYRDMPLCLQIANIYMNRVEKHSIVSIGTYGCVRGEENRHHFRNGLIAMLDELEPEIVLVYGSMPKGIFQELETRTRFVQYPDWITSMKRR